MQQLHDFAEREVRQAGEPAFLVGHSLGGFLSLMCAARHPQLARGVLLLDSPLLGGWKATALGAMKRTQLVGSISPGARQPQAQEPLALAATPRSSTSGTRRPSPVGRRRCCTTTSRTARTTKTASAC